VSQDRMNKLECPHCNEPLGLEDVDCSVNNPLRGYRAASCCKSHYVNCPVATKPPPKPLSFKAGRGFG